MISNENLWDELLGLLARKLVILPDKLEETVEATLWALWWKVYGTPMSVIVAAHSTVLPDISQEQEDELRSLIAQRLSGKPLAHLIGRQHFMGLELLASPDALVPRKETELLGEAALKLLQNMAAEKVGLVYIDVCTGAGNLPVALASRVPGMKTYASDISGDALRIAQQNIDIFDLRERVLVRKGDLLAPFDSEEFYKKVDLLTCNPPYISSGKVAEMHSEISDYEPGIAFDGGPFGITILRRLIREAPKYLKPGGWLAFEVGLGQGEKMIKHLEKKDSYCQVRPVIDACGEIRAILGQV